MLYTLKPIIKLTQASLDLIIKQHRLFLQSRPNGKRALLARHELTGLVFRDCDLSGVDFSGSVLLEADFSNSILNSCIFFGCDLRKANFQHAHLLKADLRGAALRGALMSHADLTGADLREGSFATYDQNKGLDFSSEKAAWLEGIGNVDLRGAKMESVKLSGAIAINSNFEDADLTNVKAKGANLTGANLSGANLTGADLTNCELRDVNMRGANLVSAMVDYSSFVNVDMTGALTDKPAGRTMQELPFPLEQMLEQHALWLSSTGAKGQRMDLGGYDMRGAAGFNKSDMTMLLADHSVWYAQDFANVNMQASHFAHGDMRNCNFDNADLRGSNFTKANLVGSKLRNVQFGPLMLNGKRMLKTNFAGANLRYTDFTGSVLKGINFAGADLSFADFGGAEIKDCLFHDAIMEEVKMPPHISKNFIIIREK